MLKEGSGTPWTSSWIGPPEQCYGQGVVVIHFPQVAMLGLGPFAVLANSSKHFLSASSVLRTINQAFLRIGCLILSTTLRGR